MSTNKPTNTHKLRVEIKDQLFLRSNTLYATLTAAYMSD